MGAAKITQINTDYEADMLREKVNILEEVLKFSVAETVQALKKQVKELENEAVALRAADAEKDKMITEKNNQIVEIKKNFTTRLESKLQWERKQFEAELEEKLKTKENNMNYNNVRPLKEKVEQANNERDRIQTMYNSLLDEFSQVKNTLETHTNLLYQIIDIVSNSSSIDDAKDEIEEVITDTQIALGIEYKNNRKPSKKEKEEFTLLVGTLSKNMSNKEIATKLYNDRHPFLTTVDTESGREQKIGRYLKKYRKDME